LHNDVLGFWEGDVAGVVRHFGYPQLMCPHQDF
jgi:hypothetical protein